MEKLKSLVTLSAPMILKEKRKVKFHKGDQGEVV